MVVTMKLAKNKQAGDSPQEENFFIEIIKFALLAAIIVIPFRMFIAEPYIVQGASMSPTFETGNYLIINKFGHKLSNLERGDIVVFRYPNDPKRFFIKRIIGLPGETLRINNRIVSVADSPDGDFIELEEPYIKNTLQNNVETDLAEDEYFVMGDNRGNSSDSRSWGPLNKTFIKGEPVVQLLPIRSIGINPGEAVPIINK